MGTQLSSFRVLSGVPLRETAGPVSFDRKDLGGRLESLPKSVICPSRTLGRLTATAGAGDGVGLVLVFLLLLLLLLVLVFLNLNLTEL